MELEVKLKKNSWHYKLQGFTFGENQPELHSLCPYFWLTIFCVLILPITLIVKPIKYIAKKTKERRLERERQEMEEFLKNMSVDSVLEAVKKKKKVGWIKLDRYEIWNMLRRWQEKYNATEEECVAFHQKLAKKLCDIDNEKDRQRRVKELAKIAKAEAKQERSHKVNVARIVKRTKLAVGILISVLLAFLIYKGIVALINIEWQPINWEKVLFTLIAIGVVAIFILVVISFVKIITNIEKYYDDRDDLKWYSKPIFYLFKGLFWVIKWPLILIFEIFKFIFGYFKSTKDNYCPGIIWEEDQKPQN